MVDHRTQELEEEKGKLQAILDNVASAFVMLDGNRRIQTASAAFSSITGLNLKEVLGKDSVTVFRAAGLCQMTEQTDGTTADKVESHLDRIVDRAAMINTSNTPRSRLSKTARLQPSSRLLQMSPNENGLKNT